MWSQISPALSHHISHHAVLLFSPWSASSKVILLICFLVIFRLPPSSNKGSRAVETERPRHQLLGPCPALHKYLVTEWITSSTEKTNAKLIPLFTLRTFMGWLQPQFPGLAISLLPHLNPGTLALSLVPKQEDFLLSVPMPADFPYPLPCPILSMACRCFFLFVNAPEVLTPIYRMPFSAPTWRRGHRECSTCILLPLSYWYISYDRFNML